MYRVLKRCADGQLLRLEPRRSLYGAGKCGIQCGWARSSPKLHIEGRICGLSPRMRLRSGKRPSGASEAITVLGWKYSGNRHHPTEKPVTSLQPLIESFTHPNAVCGPVCGQRLDLRGCPSVGRRYIGIELLEQYHRAGNVWLPYSRPCSRPANDDWFMPEAA